jgi:pimeloyl-ACP methyl ester carboxylesterase
MPRPLYRQRWSWVEGKRLTRQQKIPGIESADLAFSRLADLGLMTTRQLADFQDATGLADLSWRAFWNKSTLHEADGNYRAMMRRMHGFVIFMHGWNGTRDIWEHLPALVCAANPRLVSLVPDLNGFGGSPFLADVPALEQCSPSAVMQSVVRWVDMLGLRSSPRAQRRRRVITFVGHSTGGAALFYFGPKWRSNEFSRCAVAPTLLVEQEIRQQFYRALGLAAGEEKPRLTPRVLERMIGDVCDVTREEQLDVFKTTPMGTLTQSLYALTTLSDNLRQGPWRNFRVILAHDDHLLKVSPMLNLLDDLEFASNQVQVVWGDHYLFSAGSVNRRVHLRNHEVVLGEILHLHELCRERQASVGIG